jgi:hypothetical protein
MSPIPLSGAVSRQGFDLHDFGHGAAGYLLCCQARARSDMVIDILCLRSLVGTLDPVLGGWRRL